MSDRIHRVLVYLIAMAMVTAVAAAPTVAQKVDPEAERVFEVAANADTVDGRHAIGATANKAARAYKLVATNKYGQLPSNIVRPRFRDLKGVPAGFRDGVDNVGVSRITITRVVGPTATIDPGEEIGSTASCPAGSVLVGGGAYGSHDVVRLSVSYPHDSTTWSAYGTNTGAADGPSIGAYALCISVDPFVAVGTATRGVEPSNRRSR